MLAALVVRSHTNCDISAALCATSKSLIAVSMALLRRSYPLRGASDAPVLSRFARTIDKSQRGGLPAPFGGKMWAGPGSLEACSGCDDKIAHAEIEYEIELHETLTFRFHAECYKAWLSYRAE
jgi:hypothetical protein